MFFLFAASLAVLSATSYANANASPNNTCDASVFSSNNPWPGARIVDFDNAPWSLSLVDAWNMGDQEGGGSLLARQRQCQNPGWVPRCPGPRPCCPPSYTVCCTQSGTCCPAGSICAPNMGCCPTGSTYCGGTVCCPTGIAQCCKQGSPRCCPESGSCCGSTCCLSSETCCGDTCCTSNQRCENRRCLNPAPPSTPPTTGSGNDEDEPEVEVETEITIEPSDPGIDYSGNWTDTGGSCNNGTRITFEVESKFTYKFRGNEMVVSFVAKDEEAEVSVELNGVEIEKVTIPAQTSASQCQLQDAWRRDFTSPDEDNEVTFTFLGAPITNGKRAPVALELGQIRYVSVSRSTSRPTSPFPTITPGSSNLNGAVGKAAFSAATVATYAAMMVLIVGIYAF